MLVQRAGASSLVVFAVTVHLNKTLRLRRELVLPHFPRPASASEPPPATRAQAALAHRASWRRISVHTTLVPRARAGLQARSPAVLRRKSSRFSWLCLEAVVSPAGCVSKRTLRTANNCISARRGRAILEEAGLQARSPAVLRRKSSRFSCLADVSKRTQKSMAARRPGVDRAPARLVEQCELVRQGAAGRGRARQDAAVQTWKDPARAAC